MKPGALGFLSSQGTINFLVTSSYWKCNEATDRNCKRFSSKPFQTNSPSKVSVVILTWSSKSHFQQAVSMFFTWNMINLSAAKPQVISHSLSLFWALAEQHSCIFLGLGKPCSMDSCSQFYSLCLWMWVGMAEFTVHSSDMRSKPCQRHFGVIEEQRCIEAAGRDLGCVWSLETRNQVVFPLFSCSGMHQGCQSVAWLRCSSLVTLAMTSAAAALSMYLIIPTQRLSVPVWHRENDPGTNTQLA